MHITKTSVHCIINLEKWSEIISELELFCDNSHALFAVQEWYFVTKIVVTYCEKNCSSDQEIFLKFKAAGREFAKFLRSLEQFIQTVKGQNNFW